MSDTYTIALDPPLGGTHLAIIEQIVDRCHVSRSDRAVIHYAVSRLKAGRKTFFAQPRAWRKRFLRAVVTRHADNRRLYAYVMGGH